MKAQQMLKLIMGLVAISFLNVACQGNLQSDPTMGKAQVEGLDNNDPVTSPDELSEKVDLKAVQDTVTESEKAMDEAHSLLEKFSNSDGSIKIWSLMFSSSSSTEVQSQSIFIIYEKLSEVFGKIIDKVSVVKSKFNEARAQLAIEAAKLDPTRPDHQIVLEEINKMMAQIDKAESQFSMTLNQLAGQLDLVNHGIDMLTASGATLFPGAGIIIGILTNQVKMAINEFQAKLRNL